MTLLERAIAALDGVENATVATVGDVPSGVRVHLAASADEGAIARQIQNLLAEHGLESNLAPPRSKLEPVTPPPPPVLLERVAAVDGAGSDPVSVPSTDPQPAQPSTLAEIQITYRSRSAVVTARADDGAESSRRTRADSNALRQAVVDAVTELIDPELPAPGIVDVSVRDVADQQIVTVVLEVDRGELRAGSSVIEVGFEHALAQAVWSALSI